MGDQPLLQVSHLTTAFDSSRGSLRAVDDVSFSVAHGKTLAVVGESGCGKSVTALSIMRLVPKPPGRIEGGVIEFDGKDLLKLSEPAMRRVRGGEIAMIFQEPMTSLNPVYTVGTQIVEAIRIHRDDSPAQARDRAIKMLQLVGIPSPAERFSAYPHELSGGMRQRVMIAMALSCDPKLLIADEPTTALDVTIQAQILDLLRRLQDELGMSIVFITHDLGVVAEFSHDVAVMYAGRVVERASVKDLFRDPRHPYTRGLLASVPALGADAAGHASNKKRRLPTIEGIVPDLRELPPGCRFADRCALLASDRLDADGKARCRETEPELLEVPEAAGAGRLARCHHAGVGGVMPIGDASTGASVEAPTEKTTDG